MLQTALKLLASDDPEKRHAAELFLRFALHEHSSLRFCDSEELLRMDFRDVARELTGNDSFEALAEYYKANMTCTAD